MDEDLNVYILSRNELQQQIVQNLHDGNLLIPGETEECIAKLKGMDMLTLIGLLMESHTLKEMYQEHHAYYPPIRVEDICIN